VPETGLCGVPPGKAPWVAPTFATRERYAPLQSPRFVHNRFFVNDRPVTVKSPLSEKKAKKMLDKNFIFCDTGKTEPGNGVRCWHEALAGRGEVW
jgi:hypothetical protein